MFQKFPVLLAATVVLFASACKKTVEEELPDLPAPTLTAISSSSGAAGDKVTITGTNFTNASAVTFGGVAAASFSVKDAATIEAVATLIRFVTGNVITVDGGRTL